MINILMGFLTILILIALFSLIGLANCGLFETECIRQQFRTIHFVREVEGELLYSTISRSELVEYNKKWWQMYKFEPLPDEWVFDSDETKKMWEKIHND